MKNVLTAFVLVVCIQLAVPASMILKREATLEHGKSFLFKTAPVDPYDAFRGRYVALRFEQNSVEVVPGDDFVRGERVYGIIHTNEDGFAYFSELLRERPTGNDYLKMHVWWSGASNTTVNIPFDRFYMDEYEAPEAERVYWENTTRSNRNAHVEIKVKAGFGVLKDLYIDKKPIREYLALQKEGE